MTESDNKYFEEHQEQQQQQLQPEEEYIHQEEKYEEEIIVKEIENKEEEEEKIEIIIEGENQPKQTIEEEEEQLSLESPLTETDKDFEQEKEPIVVVEEEGQVIDEIEKDLQLRIDTEEADEMESQLNPDAKEFVPLSPTRNEFQSPPPGLVENGKSPFVNPIFSNFSDAVVSQSPRKNDALIMEDVLIPEENDFDKEANQRPHEVNLLEENFQRIGSPDELNLKESMQVDDKLEQEYKDDSQNVTFEEEKQQHGDDYKVLESSFEQYSNGFQNKIDDPMNRSFYEGRDSDILADPAKNVLNTTQPLPDADDVEEPSVEKHHVEINGLSNKELDFLGGSGEPVFEKVDVSNNFASDVSALSFNHQMESSDNFEVEKFVEEIKGVDENFKDVGLSPTIPEFATTAPDFAATNEIQTVEETIFATHSPMKIIQDESLDTFIVNTSTVSNMEEITPPQAAEQLIEVQQTQITENIPEGIELSQALEKVKKPQVVEEMSQQKEEVLEERPAVPIQETPEPEAEKIVEIPQEDAKIEPKTEVIAAAAVAIAAVAGVGVSAVTKKKSSTAVPSKPDAKKVLSKTAPKATDAKKAEVKPKAPISKPSSAPISKTASKTSTMATKPTVPSSASAAPRPKPSSTTLPPPIKRPSAITKTSTAPKTTDASTKPVPASRTTSLTTTTTAAPRRPVTSATASR